MGFSRTSPYPFSALSRTTGGLNFENSREWKEKNGKIPGDSKNFNGIPGSGSKNNWKIPPVVLKVLMTFQRDTVSENGHPWHGEGVQNISWKVHWPPSYILIGTILNFWILRSLGLKSQLYKSNKLVVSKLGGGFVSNIMTLIVVVWRSPWILS